jgi:cytochrome c oxidase cbb3-type subunit III
MRCACFILATAFLVVLGGCEREQRSFRHEPSSINPPSTIRMSTLYPGTSPPPSAAGKNPYEAQAYMVSEGKKLYEAYNCVGCHSHGGGGIGPPLMDSQWIYGSEPNNIYSTIVEGRPNGMPSYRGKIPEYQVWEIVSYVRSMSGLVPMDVPPSRSDHMSTRRPENATEEQAPSDNFYSPQEQPK